LKARRDILNMMGPELLKVKSFAKPKNFCKSEGAGRQHGGKDGDFGYHKPCIC